jgi:uncharacterized integral membrane protein
MQRTTAIKLGAIAILVAALATVIAQNRAPVQAHFLLITIEMPLILLLALTAFGGFVLGVLVALLARARGDTAKG